MSADVDYDDDAAGDCDDCDDCDADFALWLVVFEMFCGSSGSCELIVECFVLMTNMMAFTFLLHFCFSPS